MAAKGGFHLIFFGHVANVAAATAAGRFDLTQGFRHVVFVQIDNGQTGALCWPDTRPWHDPDPGLRQ